MNPITCPFCSHEIDEEASETDNDSWD
jgi:hypothetical protein